MIDLIYGDHEIETDINAIDSNRVPGQILKSWEELKLILRPKFVTGQAKFEDL